mmetsp:Transcript_19032/g.54407  ORF Transcript_19032/g.54407 Transcript_19032/m.54407 type:complete len:113 (+) Transcript_19032:924-1262(+)
MLRVEEQTAYKDAMSATYAALGGGGGAMAASSSRSLPAASSSALLSASFPGPGVWRRRRMLVGGCVVGLACPRRLVAPETDAGGRRRRPRCQAVGLRRRKLPRCKFCCKLPL